MLGSVILTVFCNVDGHICQPVSHVFCLVWKIGRGIREHMNAHEKSHVLQELSKTGTSTRFPTHSRQNGFIIDKR